ncbi:MAG: DUF4126 domain-containing protein [Candidatus Omnitrophica bacterium]|nr:DUF4126 domain-containing protein [Candidatus Omnitrophota bacterium]
MEILQTINVLLGSTWASGINLYMTVALLGVSHRMNWIELPGNLESLSHPLVIGVAVILYAIEFIADKVPVVDSMWDSVHTFIRPAGGALIGYLAMADVGPAVQIPVALLSGSVSLDSHLTKATSRAAINTSPEPVSNSVASVTEDVAVAGMFFLMIQHPVIAGIAVILFIIFSIWFLKKMFHLVKKIFFRKEVQSIQ